MKECQIFPPSLPSVSLVNSPSVIATSLFSSLSKNPLLTIISLSETFPPYPLEIKLIAPTGVILIKNLLVL